jgi:hypothetical protein
MEERHNIYLRRLAGQPKPWTQDTIMQQYRFCNVYRELDTVTIWVREHIREPYAEHPNLWFMLCAARQINHPGTLEELIADKKAWPHGALSAWEPERLRMIMNDRKARGEQVYTGAYMLTNVLNRNDPRPHDKPWFTAYRVLDSVRDMTGLVLQAIPFGMEATHAVLRTGYGWGGFMAYEVVTDMRWTRYGKAWKDVNTFAHAGPGALRGLNRLLGRPLHASLPSVDALAAMSSLLARLSREWPKPSKKCPRLELREVEHSLCEFDKWTRAYLGEGRPRTRYNGGADHGQA